jgi:uncharacterized protein
MWLGGCGKKAMNKDEIHVVSEEVVAAARNVIGPQAEITIRPEGSPASGKNKATIWDHIRISLQDPAKLSAVEEAVGAVAKKHDLTMKVFASSQTQTELVLTRDSQITHTIGIMIERGELAAPNPGANVPKVNARGPKLAIIVDDLGADLTVAQKIVKLPYPLTISVIPNLADSAKVADAAHERGDEVLLHLPMEAEGAAKAEPVELRVGMPQQQVEDILTENLKSVPHAAGVNNHQGSRATADAQLMDALMASLRERGLFFVDSRTSVETVAYDTAEKDGVKAAFRNAQFLDDTETPAAISKQLELAERDAVKKGWAITIGHPHPATIEVLRENLPRMRSKGITLVFASDVAK